MTVNLQNSFAQRYQWKNLRYGRKVIGANCEKYQDADGSHFWLKGDDFSFGKAT